MALDEYNLRREAVTKERLKTVKSLDDLLGYLGDTSFYDYDQIILSDCSSINNAYTINTLVFDPAGQNVYYAVAPGFSALANVYRYDLKTRSLKLYRPATASFKDPKRQAKMRWFDTYLNLKYCEDYAGILKHVDLNDPDLDPRQLRYAAEAWLMAPDQTYGPQLVTALNAMSAKFPRYAMPHLYRAKLLKHLGRQPEAIQALNQSLSCPDLTPDFELDALLLLAQVSGQAAWQQRYVSQIDQLKQTWLIEDHYAKPYREFKEELEAEKKN